MAINKKHCGFDNFGFLWHVSLFAEAEAEGLVSLKKKKKKKEDKTGSTASSGFFLPLLLYGRQSYMMWVSVMMCVRSAG